jgi:hypothetical protein
VIHALTEGLVFQRLLAPDLTPDEIFRAAFATVGKTATDANGRGAREPPLQFLSV